MTRRRPALRSSAVVAAAALAVHQLRYLPGAPGAEAQTGHAYLAVVMPLVATLLATVLAQTLRHLATPPDALRPASWRALWGFAFGGLLAIYCGQEALEGLLSSGHHAGVQGIFGDGGLAAIPLSLLLGGAVAWVLRRPGARIEAPAWARSNRLMRLVAPGSPVTLCLAPLASSLPMLVGGNLRRGPPPSFG